MSDNGPIKLSTQLVIKQEKWSDVEELRIGWTSLLILSGIPEWKPRDFLTARKTCKILSVIRMHAQLIRLQGVMSVWLS